MGRGGEGFGEVDAEDFVGDGVVDPALFDEGDEEGAGFFVGFEAEGVEGVGVGVGLDGGGGGEDEDLGVALRLGRNTGASPSTIESREMAPGFGLSGFDCARAAWAPGSIRR